MDEERKRSQRKASGLAKVYQKKKEAVKFTAEKLVLVLFATLLVAGALAPLAYAAAATTPVGPDTITIANSTRMVKDTSGRLVNAEAGNVTELVITDTRITQAWQGYFGNITGTITLDDANNNTLYSWALANPVGEIYASNGSSVTWAQIRCVNLTSNGTVGSTINESILETYYGINSTDVDGISETFNASYTNATGFDVGSIHFNTNNLCPLTYTNINDTYQAISFQEVLLTDNASIVYTSLIERNTEGFKVGKDSNDFQMLVAENGHPGYESTVTPYYFFVELS